VDVDKLIVVRPDYAEQVVDMVENFLYAEDIGLVAVDSLAAMVTTQEADSSAEKANVGGAALAIGKLVRKTTLALNHAERDGRFPTVLYVNQIRLKIGVMFGNPEDMPGGNAPKYQSAMTVRVYGKNVTDNAVSKTKPVRKHTSFVIKKWKVPIIATHGEYEMATVAHKGLAVGEVDDWNTLSTYLKDFGYLEKTKTGWRLLDAQYKTLKEARERVYTDWEFGMGLRNDVIQKVLEHGVEEPADAV
jgi:recombination protein RecA